MGDQIEPLTMGEMERYLSAQHAVDAMTQSLTASEVKRLSVYRDNHDEFYMKESATGDYVLYSDYARLRAELATMDAAIDALKSRFVRAVAEEQELPGAMPIEMWGEIRRDRDAAAECLRIVVRKTKSGIMARLFGAPPTEGES